MEYVFSDKVMPLKPSAIREMLKTHVDPDMISLAAGNPAAESFPVNEFCSLGESIYARKAAGALQYGITEGYAPLRKKVAERLKSKFDIGKEFDDVVITSGGQQGIELTCKIFCNEGDVVLCESPSFIGALNSFRSYGTKLVGIDMDDDGIIIEELEKAISENSRIKLLYIIPTFQNPTGITTSLERRKKIYEICKKNNIIIIEDNPYGELRFAGQDIPTIKSMDDEGIVVYCGSFSKTLSPGMRVGFVCANSEITQKLVVCKQVSDVHTNLYFQILVSEYIDNYDFDAHIDEIKALYRRKCGIMLSEIEKKFPKCVKVTHPEGGLFIWCTLPDNIDISEFTKKALENKVSIVLGKTFLPDTSKETHSFRLNYSMPTDEQIVEGIERVSKTMKEFGL